MPRLSAEQKTARRLGLGASDIAEMLGISPYQGASPVRLFADKAGLLSPDEDDEETIEQRVGHAIEPALVKLYEQESGRRVITIGEYVESVVHPDHPWARCNLDARIDGEPIGLEIKHVGIGMHDDWDLNADDGIPNYVRTQCYWQCFVANLAAVHVVCLVAGRFRVYYVDRNEELEAALFREASAFMDLVRSKRMPPLDASSAARQLLEKLYPPPPIEVTVEADEELVALMHDRTVAADAESVACERKEILNNLIRESLGKLGATTAYCRDYKAMWRPAKDGSRPLRVNPKGDAKKPRVPKANATKLPILIDDGEAF